MERTFRGERVVAHFVDVSIGNSNGLFHWPRAPTRCRATWPPSRRRVPADRQRPPRATGTIPAIPAAGGRRLAPQGLVTTARGGRAGIASAEPSTAALSVVTR